MLDKEKVSKKIDAIDWDQVVLWVGFGAIGLTGVLAGHMIGWNIGWNNGCCWSAKAVKLYGPEVLKPLKEANLTSKQIVEVLNNPELKKYVRYFKVVK